MIPPFEGREYLDVFLDSILIESLFFEIIDSIISPKEYCETKYSSISKFNTNSASYANLYFRYCNATILQ